MRRVSRKRPRGRESECEEQRTCQLCERAEECLSGSSMRACANSRGEKYEEYLLRARASVDWAGQPDCSQVLFYLALPVPMLWHPQQKVSLLKPHAGCLGVISCFVASHPIWQSQRARTDSQSYSGTWTGNEAQAVHLSFPRGL